MNSAKRTCINLFGNYLHILFNPNIIYTGLNFTRSMLLRCGIRIPKGIFCTVCFFTFASGRIFSKRIFARTQAGVGCLFLAGGLRLGVLVFNSHSAYWIFGFHFFLLVPNGRCSTHSGLICSSVFVMNTPC